MVCSSFAIFPSHTALGHVEIPTRLPSFHHTQLLVTLRFQLAIPFRRILYSGIDKDQQLTTFHG